MDLMNRGMQHPTHSNVPQHNPNAGVSRSKRSSVMAGFKMASVALLFSGTILVLALVGYLVLGNQTSSENKYVQTDKYQAVFLNGGQVYFGHIQALNNRYLSVADIYYLRVNQQVQPKSGTTTTDNNVSLVKLGCELHGPDDRMVINREQVIFWENLKKDGQVAKAISDFKTKNPNGQPCTTTTK